MKNSKRIKTILFIITIIFAGCKKVNTNKAEESKYFKNDISLNDKGFLEFKNQKVFDQVVKEVNTLNGSKLKELKGKFSFVSMKDFYRKANQEENAYFDSLKEKDETVIRNLKDQTFVHSEFVTRNKTKFIFVDDGTFIMNIYRNDLSELVNEDGIVKIGNQIYQYSFNYLKILEDGNSNNIEILKKTFQSNPSYSIKVNKVTYSNVLDETNSLVKTFVTNYENECEGVNNGGTVDYRVRGRLSLATVQEPIYEYYECNCEDIDGHLICQECSYFLYNIPRNYFHASATFYRRSIFGWWVKGDVDNIGRPIALRGSYNLNGQLRTIDLNTFTDEDGDFFYSIYNAYNQPSVDITNANITFDASAECTLAF